MTYGAFLVVFLVLPIGVLALALRRRMTPAWRWSVGAVAVIAVLYTAPWDNYIIAQGVWSYPPGRVLGPTLGFVPLEEYAFFVLQVLLTGLVLLALMGRQHTPASLKPSRPPSHPGSLDRRTTGSDRSAGTAGAGRTAPHD
jgi:lycopene cyclase domain-containing protein